MPAPATTAPPTRQIDVVPPPALAQLLREEAQPAYLYHRAPLGATALELKGLKQHFPAEKVYLGGETSRIELPAGTDLRLKGTADKDLDRVTLVPRGLTDFLKALRSQSGNLPHPGRPPEIPRTLYPQHGKALAQAVQAPPPAPNAKTSPIHEFLKQLTPAENNYLWAACMGLGSAYPGCRPPNLHACHRRRSPAGSISNSSSRIPNTSSAAGTSSSSPARTSARKSRSSWRSSARPARATR